MGHVRLWVWAAVAMLLVLWGENVWGQQLAVERIALPASVVQPDATVGAALRSLASRSGVAFVGQVSRIRPAGDVVEITFTVQQPVLGPVGAAYTLREWVGLWEANPTRYRLGQRALYFFHAPGAGGLSSPVDGMEGIVPLLPAGADTPPLLDVRRLSTRLVRAPGQPLPGLDAAAVSVAEAAATVAAWRHPGFEPVLQPLPIPLRPRPVVTQTGFLPVLGPAAGSLMPVER